VRRILIVRLGSLGDLIHTLPAVAALRHAYPDAAIDWLVDGVHRDLLDLVPVISSVIALPDRTARAWLRVRARLRQHRYDLALDFQGLIKSAMLARLSGARRTVGFARAALREPAAAAFYTSRVRVTGARHVIDKNLMLAAAVGAAATEREFPIGPVNSPITSWLAAQGLDRFALVNGGAAWPNKRWPADRFGAIAAWLRGRHGLRSVVVWGPGEQDLASAIAALAPDAALVSPATGLPDLIALARAARLMVSGDTGPTHVAAAVGTPVVALFGPTDPHRNGPWSAADRIVSRYDRCRCPYARRCRHPETWCLESIAIADVQAAIDQRLTS
jgi:lipopolysaccharide heptosyltransferase I